MQGGLRKWGAWCTSEAQLKLHVPADAETDFCNEREYYIGAVLEGGGAGYAEAVSLSCTVV
jgi:hypothetical protein